MCFVFKPVENCINEENEEDSVQLSAVCSPHNGKDRRDSFSTLWSQPGYNSKMSTSIHLTHLKDLVNRGYVDSNAQAVDVDNHHSIGRNTEQGATTSTDEDCSSLMLNVVDELSELTDDSAELIERSIAVKKHHVVEASSCQGSPRTDDVDVDSHHSIGRNTEQVSTTSTDEECSSLMLLAAGDVSRTDDGKHLL